MNAVPDSPPQTAYEYAVAYVHAGFSVIPVPRGEKAAKISWKKYQEAIADPAQIAKWFNVPNPPNIGLIMGRVSGNAVALDIDYAPFAVYNEEHVLPTLPTHVTPLCQRTGSGKLHLIVRSVEPINTTILSQRGTNITLGDIKAEGGYVLAAPSLHPSGGTYHFILGDIFSVPRFQNARNLFDNLEAKYAEFLGTDPHYLLMPKMQVLPPVEGEARLVLETEIKKQRLGRRIENAVLIGTKPQDGDWPTFSERDFAVVCAFRERGWSQERIEVVFATFPIGGACYRDHTRAHHGSSWLALTVQNVDKQLAKKPTNLVEAQGIDWQITKITRPEYDIPEYEMVVFCPDGVERTLYKVTTEDILSDRRMIGKLATLFAAVPKFRPQHSGRGYMDFANALLELASREVVPRVATSQGYLQELVREYLKSPSIREHPPERLGEMGGGWMDEEEAVYLRGRSVIHHIRQRVGPVKLEEVWAAVRAMGAREIMAAPFEGHSERVWKLSASAQS